MGVPLGGLLFAALVWVQHDGYVALAVLLLVRPLVQLVHTDLAEHRLPNRLTALAGLAASCGVGLVAATRPAPGSTLLRAAVGASVLGGIYLALAILSSGSGMGLGDAKLAPSLGLLPAALDWAAWLTVAITPFLLGGCWGLVLLRRGGGRRAVMAFGPCLVAGWGVALVVAHPVG